MPIDLIDAGKLLLGVILISLPGYLWSYLFKQITRLERIVFGFIIGIVLFSAGPYFLNVFFNITLSQNVLFMVMLIYTISAIMFFGYQWYKTGRTLISLSSFRTQKNLLLLGLLGFTVFITFLPHLIKSYYLPFHVDEWFHWSYTQAIMNTGSTTFRDPYTGSWFPPDAEIGFHTYTASVSWLSTSSLLSIMLFMPSIFAVFLGITAFCIGERAEKKFGLEACFLVALIPTTIRYLGPSFYVPVALGLLLFLFLVWIIQQNQYQLCLLIVPILWCLLLIHPPSAFAGIIIVCIFAIMLLIEKNIIIALTVGLSLILTWIPFFILLVVPSRFYKFIDIFLNSLSGEQYIQGLSMIYINFSELGIITWVFFVIGYYYIIIKGKSLHFCLGISAITFMGIIGLYSLFGYGVPDLYNRSFLYLFVCVALVAAIGLREGRDVFKTILSRYILHPITRYDKHLRHILFPVLIVLLLLSTSIPFHVSTPYYKMIDENDYATFLWIRENIATYRDANHTYQLAAVHPYQASPFSAVTGLYIFTSSMNPVIRYNRSEDMESFLNDLCRNTTFLKKHRITVIYGLCDNRNLTMIHPKVYLYQ